MGGKDCWVKNRTEKERKKTKFVCYPVSLEVDENSSSDLGNQDEQEACKVLEGKKRVIFKYIFKKKRKKSLN